MKKLLKMIKSKFIMWSWCCAIRFNDNNDTCLIDNKEDEFVILKNSWRYWIADPFLYKDENQLYLFFEAFDLLKRKGVLGYRTIEKNNIGKINICYESDSHLSFPFIFDDNGERYIIPESANSGELYALKCTWFPDKWKKDKVLLKGNFVDTVQLKKDDKTFYISEQIKKSGQFDRLDLFYENDGKICSCKKNPVKLDDSSARGAGKIFVQNSQLIRPSQDCSSSYGERLNFNRIINLNCDEYSEELVDKVSYKDIKLNKPIKVDGIHTYNRLDNVEVIDLRIPGKFNFVYSIGLFYKTFQKIVMRSPANKSQDLKQKTGKIFKANKKA